MGGALLAAPVFAFADEIDSGDTAWMITATALVLFMTIPGLSLFYAGMVRRKNVLSMFMQCFATAGLVAVLWAIYGYSLAFDEGNALIGGFGKAFLSGVGVDATIGTIPETVFMMYQMAFAIITPGTDRRCICGADEVLGAARVHGALGHTVLRAGLLLGLGGRMARQARHHRLRGRDGGPHQRRNRGSRRRAGARTAQGLPQDADASEQPHLHDRRGRHALGRLARVQCGLRTGRGRHGRHGGGGHPVLRRGRCAELDVPGVDSPRQTDRARDCVGRHRRPRCDHPCLGGPSDR